MKIPEGLTFQMTKNKDIVIETDKEYGIGDKFWQDYKIVELIERPESYVVVVRGWYDNNDYNEPELLTMKFIAEKTN
jgi:Tfp pilus assembly protein PilZ